MYLIFINFFLHTFRITSAQMDLDTEELERDLTPHTFFDLSNGSKEYKPFNLTELEMFARKQMSNVETFNEQGLKHSGSPQHVSRSCYYIVSTYKSALTDIRKYFPLRYLYVENLQYEVGYLTQEIVSRYQIIIELYHLVQRRFEKYPKRHFAPASYMLYIYTNILEQCKVIIHLCNMMHELPLKYSQNGTGIFDDYHVISKSSDYQYLSELQIYEARMKRIQKEKRNRLRERNKLRKKNLAMSLLKIPVVQRQPNKSQWPLNYGWSIEDGW